MKSLTRILAACVGVFAPLSSAAAADLTLNTVSIATASDDDPQDGIFDSMSPFNLGSVDNNGWTSSRSPDFRRARRSIRLV